MKEISILNINQFKETESKNEFYSNTLKNHLITSHLHIEKPHKHDFYAAILFTQGSGEHSIDFKAFKVQPGSLFLLAPGQTHNWELSPDADGYIFFHTKEFYDLQFIKNGMSGFSFFSALNNKCSTILIDKELKDMASLFIQILEEYQMNRIKRNQLIMSIINQVYIKFERNVIHLEKAERDNLNNYYLKFQDFEGLVEANFLSVKSPEQYANMMNITAKHLNRINKLIVGKTTTDIIIDRVLLEAKRMLIYSKNNLNEIAYSLGYDDYPYFSRLFKKKMGYTPSVFLKKQELLGKTPS